MDKLRRMLEERKADGNLRRLSLKSDLIDFYSNDYLGLARSKELYEEIKKETDKLTGSLNGSTGSRLLSGNSFYFQQTESSLANFFLSEATLLFNSGYSANTALLSSVPQKGDTILYDELIHASLKEGARLSFAKRFSFRHNDPQDLEKKIKNSEGACYVLIESVYSMDGDFAPLMKILEVCEKYGAYLILDEAHSTGLWGKDGRGIACELGIQNRIFARVYTFGKGMGIHGACIAGTELLIEFLINFARPFIYTTALPPHGVASVNAAFAYIKKYPELSQRLFQKIALFKKEASDYAPVQSAMIESESAIQVVRVCGNEKTKALAKSLVKEGFDVRAILSPTVKEGEERLRICLHVYNSDEEIKLIVQTISKYLVI